MSGLTITIVSQPYNADFCAALLTATMRHPGTPSLLRDAVATMKVEYSHQSHLGSEDAPSYFVDWTVAILDLEEVVQGTWRCTEAELPQLVEGIFTGIRNKISDEIRSRETKVRELRERINPAPLDP